MPRGTVKSLRVFTYHFGYQQIAGIDHRVGTDGPWEVKRILGTVPVEADGSALFRVPAKTPISVQPLDAEGKAVQLMRSWMTAMPGETLSCVGCHDHRSTLAAEPRRRWPCRGRRGDPALVRPAADFSFRREVQPVLDQLLRRLPRRRAAATTARRLVDLRGDQGAYVCLPRRRSAAAARSRGAAAEKLVGRYGGIFEPSYIALRQPGPRGRAGERPAPAAADGVPRRHQRTDPDAQARGTTACSWMREAWDRLITWIDLNAPCHGTWGEFAASPATSASGGCELRQLYGGVVEDGGGRRLDAGPAGASSRSCRTQAATQRRPVDGWPAGRSTRPRRAAASSRRRRANADASIWAAA